MVPILYSHSVLTNDITHLLALCSCVCGCVCVWLFGMILLTQAELENIFLECCDMCFYAPVSSQECMFACNVRPCINTDLPSQRWSSAGIGGLVVVEHALWDSCSPPPPLSITADRGGYAWTCLLWGGKGCCSTHDCVCVVIVVSSEHCLLGVSFIVVPTNDGQLRCI